jgi:hypothetical protein
LRIAAVAAERIDVGDIGLVIERGDGASRWFAAWSALATASDSKLSPPGRLDAAWISPSVQLRMGLHWENG